MEPLNCLSRPGKLSWKVQLRPETELSWKFQLRRGTGFLSRLRRGQQDRDLLLLCLRVMGSTQLELELQASVLEAA